MELDVRLNDLYNDLSGIEGRLSGTVGKVFNALLAEVKAAHPDDPVIAAIDPVGFTSMGLTASSAASLRAVVGQLAAVARGS